MTEWRMIALLVAGTLLWPVGGKWWKGWRRYVWPVVAGLLLWSLPGIGAAVTLSAVNHLGYGDRTPWPARVAVFASYGLPAVVLHPATGAWAALLCAVFIGGAMALSRRFNRVSWKVVEGAAGFLQAAVLIVAR